jgi:hypothetical protein
MKNMAYERKIGTGDELFQRIFDAARRVNDIAVRKFSVSSIS